MNFGFGKPRAPAWGTCCQQPDAAYVLRVEHEGLLYLVCRCHASCSLDTCQLSDCQTQCGTEAYYHCERVAVFAKQVSSGSEHAAQKEGLAQKQRRARLRTVDLFARWDLGGAGRRKGGKWPKPAVVSPPTAGQNLLNPDTHPCYE